MSANADLPGQTSREGRGWVCTPPTSGVYVCVDSGTQSTEPDTHAHTPEVQVVQLASTLLALGVFCLSTAKRLEVAARLAALTVDTQQLVDLDGYIRESEPDTGKSRRYLAALLGDDAKLRDALGGLAAYLREKPKAEGDGPAHMPNMPRGFAGCDCRECVGFRGTVVAPEPLPADAPKEAWDHDRQCRIAWCCVNGDKRDPASVAREMGVSETTLNVMLERGRVLSASPLVEALGKAPSMKQIAKEEKATERRVTDFRERMSIDRKQRERQSGRKPFDFARMDREMGAILARLRAIGNVDLAELMRDPVKRGALATLEADGHILRAEAPDAYQCQRYHVAKDEAERHEFKQQRRLWDQNDMDRPRRREAAEAQ